MLFFRDNRISIGLTFIDPILGWLWLARTARAGVDFLLYLGLFCIHFV
jgi:hypothetical protein